MVWKNQVTDATSQFVINQVVSHVEITSFCFI